MPQNPTITVSGMEIHLLIIEDAAYLPRRWLMRPSSGPGARTTQLFDRKLSASRTVVECAFSRFKARCHCLTARLPVGIQNVPNVLTACVILHNTCKENGHCVLLGSQWGYPSPHSRMWLYTRHRREEEAVRDAFTDFFMDGF